MAHGTPRPMTVGRVRQVVRFARRRLRDFRGDAAIYPINEALRALIRPGHPLSSDEKMSRALRRDEQGRDYFALGGWSLYFQPDEPVENPSALRESVLLVLREAFLHKELFDGPVRPNRGDVVLDLGGNIGTTALTLAREVGVEGRVYAFEPVTHTVLKRNLIANGVADRVECLAACVGAEVGTADIQICDYFIDSSIARPPGGPDKLPVRSRPVPVTTVDAFVNERNLQRLDFIKMDIEGAEELALRGAEETIRRFRPKWTVASYHTDFEGDKQHPKLVTWFEARGYEVKEVDAQRIYAW